MPVVPIVVALLFVGGGVVWAIRSLGAAPKSSAGGGVPGYGAPGSYSEAQRATIAASLANMVAQSLLTNGPGYDRDLMKRFQSAALITPSGLYTAETRDALIQFGAPSTIPQPYVTTVGNAAYTKGAPASGPSSRGGAPTGRGDPATAGLINAIDNVLGGAVRTIGAARVGPRGGGGDGGSDWLQMQQDTAAAAQDDATRAKYASMSLVNNDPSSTATDPALDPSQTPDLTPSDIYVQLNAGKINPDTADYLLTQRFGVGLGQPYAQSANADGSWLDRDHVDLNKSPADYKTDYAQQQGWSPTGAGGAWVQTGQDLRPGADNSDTSSGDGGGDGGGGDGGGDNSGDGSGGDGGFAMAVTPDVSSTGFIDPGTGQPVDANGNPVDVGGNDGSSSNDFVGPPAPAFVGPPEPTSDGGASGLLGYDPSDPLIPSGLV